MNIYTNWRDFSRRPEIARLPMNEQKRLYRLELDRTDRLLEYMALMERQNSDPNIAIQAVQQGWVTAPAKASAQAGSPGKNPASNEYIEDYYVDGFYIE